MKKLKEDKSLLLLIFLGLFGFAIGIFSNYKELWMNEQGIPPTSIGRIISLASFITVLVFFFFTIKVSQKKLKNGLTICLLLKMIMSTLLLCLSNKGNLFLIKFFMFFYVAFGELIFGSFYNLMMQITKNDVVYTKKGVIESVSSKLGFLVASILLGHYIGSYLITYNTCLLLSIIFEFISFIVFLNIDTTTNEVETTTLKETINYLKKNKILIYFLFVNMLGSMIWESIIGMKMLSLTKTIGINANIASYIVLGLGIFSNFLAILIVKKLKSKNDHINLFFKYGFRLILYFIIFLTNNKIILLITFIYMLITDAPYGFIFNSHFIHKVEDKYSLMFASMRYCTSLIGTSIGVFICGLTFDLPIKYIGLTTFVIAIIHYILATILITKKETKLVKI